MQGYELEIRNNIHRRNLIKDSKFYNLRHLSEVLIPAKLYHNPFRGSTEELLISITDFRAKNARVGWVEGQQFGFMEYKRPHDIDDIHKDLLVQIDDDGLIVGGGKIMLVNRQALNSIKTLKETAEGRKTETHSGHLPGGQHEIAIRIEIPNECYVMIDGQDGTGLLDPMPPISSTPTAPPQNGGESPVAKKRKVGEAGDGVVTPATAAVPEPKVVTLKRSIWRVKVKGQNLPPSTEGGPQSTNVLLAGRRAMVLLAVKIEGWTREKEFSKEIDWL
jgi:hypothetical protein